MKNNKQLVIRYSTCDHSSGWKERKKISMCIIILIIRISFNPRLPEVFRVTLLPEVGYIIPRADFRWPSWPPSWKICNCCYCFLLIWFLRPSFHINRHFIRFISEIRAEIHWIQIFGGHLGRHLKFFILFILDITQQYFSNRKSLTLYDYLHCLSYLVEVVLVSRIGRYIGRHIGRHLEKYSTDDIGIYPNRFADRKNIRKIAYKALYVSYNSKYCGKRQFSHKLNIWRQ